MIIGISGSARSGKDTFFNLLCKYYGKPNFFQRHAFADQLKNDLKSLIKRKFDINIAKCSDEEKELIRPLMVSYGKLARNINQDYWIKKLMNKILPYKNTKIPVITDVRYPNEQRYLKAHFDDCINVHISREGFLPVNEEEEFNNPLLKENADYLIEWKNFEKTEDEGLPFIENFVNENLKRYNRQ